MQYAETKLISWQEQREFARLSGDFNPVHMDDVAARRTQAGRALVHGMHLGLWALDQLFARGLISLPLAGFKAKFPKMVFVGETISLQVTSDAGRFVAAQVCVGEIITATLLVTRGTAGAAAFPELSSDPNVHDHTATLDLTLEQMSGMSGRVRLTEGAEAMFPAAARALGATRIRALCAASCLVGMVCPGLHSMAYSYDATFVECGETGTALEFAVTDIDERFRLVTQKVRGGGIQGKVVALARVPPIAQLSVRQLSDRVESDEFAGVRALVIGGSRGLGELTAKIIAAGGGSTAITYAVGRADAEAVCGQIVAAGGMCEVMRWDVRESAAAQLQALRRSPTHLFYFATDRIAGRGEKAFSPSVFEEFCRFYITGFEELCRALQSRSAENLTVFYPSTVFVRERPAGLTEYAMAKAAGEVLCEDLSRALPGLRIKACRLPRVLTDQNATPIPVETEDALDVMLPLIRELCGVPAPVTEERRRALPESVPGSRTM